MLPNHLSDKKLARRIAVAEGVLVALILSSTYIFIKMALGYMGPLTITALRYSLACPLLLPFVLHRRAAASWPSRLWGRFIFIGLSFYAIGNGALSWGLKYVPATTGSLLLSLTPLCVLFAGWLWLRERPTPMQLCGVVVGLAGSVLFFSPGFKAQESLGIGIIAIGLAGSVSFSVSGRSIAREQQVNTLSLTAIPLALGSGFLLPAAILVEGLPALSVEALSIVLWLAVINTALVYMLYNDALKVLAAFEMSVITNLTPLITAAWAWIFLGERLGMSQVMGVVAVVIGVVLVEWGKGI